jgi:hypothetical protein
MPSEPKLCAFCGGPAEGNCSIHRDGFGVGPEVDLCDAHGSGELPSCPQIWDRIAQPSDNDWAHRKVEVRRGQ